MTYFVHYVVSFKPRGLFAVSNFKKCPCRLVNVRGIPIVLSMSLCASEHNGGWGWG